MSIVLLIRLESPPKNGCDSLAGLADASGSNCDPDGSENQATARASTFAGERRSGAPLVMTAYVESVKLLTVQLLAAMMRLIRSGMTTEGEMKLSLYSRC